MTKAEGIGEIPVEERQRAYLAERRFRRFYDEALEQRVLQVLDPVFDRERVKPEVRKQLGDILFGADAKVQLSVSAVEALHEADLLVAAESSTEQSNDPGWTDWYGATNHPRRFRTYSYDVRLPTENSFCFYFLKFHLV